MGSLILVVFVFVAVVALIVDGDKKKVKDNQRLDSLKQYIHEVKVESRSSERAEHLLSISAQFRNESNPSLLRKGNELEMSGDGRNSCLPKPKE